MHRVRQRGTRHRGTRHRGTRHRAVHPGPQRLSVPLPTIALVGVAVVWGVTFSAVDLSVIDASGGQMRPADLVAWRFGIGALALTLIRTLTLIRRSGRSMPPSLRRRGMLLGTFLGLGFLLQTWALTYTDAMMSAFLTGMLVVIAPVAGWLIFRDRPAPVTWIAVAVATAGLAVLSLGGAGFGPGELITLGAAASWAVHLVLLARWAEPAHAVELARIQTATVFGMALLTVAVGGILGGSSPLPRVPADAATWATVLFLALLSTAGAMVLLSWAQARVSATRAAVILTLEPAVAAVTAGCLGGELGARTIAGGALLLGAMYLVEMGGRRTRPPTGPRPTRGAQRGGDRDRSFDTHSLDVQPAGARASFTSAAPR